MHVTYQKCFRIVCCPFNNIAKRSFYLFKCFVDVFDITVQNLSFSISATSASRFCTLIICIHKKKDKKKKKTKKRDVLPMKLTPVLKGVYENVLVGTCVISFG